MLRVRSLGLLLQWCKTMVAYDRGLGFGIKVAAGATVGAIGGAAGLLDYVQEVSHTGYERGETEMTSLDSTAYREYHQSLRTLGKYEFSVMYASTDSAIHDMMAGAAFAGQTLASQATHGYTIGITKSAAAVGVDLSAATSDAWWGHGDILSVSPAFPRDDMIAFSFVFNLRAMAPLLMIALVIGASRPPTMPNTSKVRTVPAPPPCASHQMSLLAAIAPPGLRGVNDIWPSPPSNPSPSSTRLRVASGWSSASARPIRSPRRAGAGRYRPHRPN